MGYSTSAAAEFEFFVFNETPESVRAKGYRALSNMTPGYFGYSMLRSSVHAELYQALLQLAAEMRMPIEGLHTETGPGVMEAALQYTESLEAADRAALFKTFTKVLMQRRGLMATFMAKWSQQLPGPERPPARLDDAPGRLGRLLRRAASHTRCRTRCAGSSAASRR